MLATILHHFVKYLFYLCLKAREEINQEWMSHGVGHLEYPLLCQQGLHLVPGDDVALLQSFDGKIFASIFVPCQDNLKLRRNY